MGQLEQTPGDRSLSYCMVLPSTTSLGWVFRCWPLDPGQAPLPRSVTITHYSALLCLGQGSVCSTNSI